MLQAKEWQTSGEIYQTGSLPGPAHFTIQDSGING